MLAWPLCHWTCPGSRVRSQEPSWDMCVAISQTGTYRASRLPPAPPSVCSLLPGELILQSLGALAPRTSHRHSCLWCFMQTVLLSFSGPLKIEKPLKRSSKPYCLSTAVPDCHKHSQKLQWSQNLCGHPDPQTPHLQVICSPARQWISSGPHP